MRTVAPSMRLKDRRVLGEFAHRLREKLADAEVWAFGSRARGDAKKESDFDVCIILPSHNEGIDDVVREVAWEVAFKHGLVFNTIIFSSSEFREGPMSESTLVENILKDKVAA